MAGRAGLAPDMASLRAYVTAADDRHYATVPEGTVALQVTHSNLRAKMLDIRLDMHSTVRAQPALPSSPLSSGPPGQRGAAVARVSGSHGAFPRRSPPSRSSCTSTRARTRTSCGWCSSPGSAQCVARAAGPAARAHALAAAQVAALDDDSNKLGFYSPANGMTLHVIDEVRAR